MRRVSVPLVDSDSYDQRWFVAASVGFPTFMLWYFGLLTLSFTFPLALVIGACLGAVSYSFTEADRAPEWSLGLPFPLGAAAIACIGFISAAMWIDTLAGHYLLTLQRLIPFLLPYALPEAGKGSRDSAKLCRLATAPQRLIHQHQLPSAHSAAILLP